MSRGKSLRQQIGYLPNAGKSIKEMPEIDENQKKDMDQQTAIQLYQSVLRSFYVWDEQLSKGVNPDYAKAHLMERLDRIRIKYQMSEEEMFAVI